MSQGPPELSPAEEELLGSLVAAAHEAGAERLVTSSSGNLSVRLAGGRLAITASHARLARLRREQVVVVPVESGDGPEEGPGGAQGARPSRELRLHRALYRRYPRVDCVLHVQSLAATTLACRPGPLSDLRFIPEIPACVRGIGEAPYLPPGTEALAEAVAEAFGDPDVRAVQMRNHGQVVVADSPGEAVERAAFLELACRIYLLSENRPPPRRFTLDELEILESY